MLSSTSREEAVYNKATDTLNRLSSVSSKSSSTTTNSSSLSPSPSSSQLHQNQSHRLKTMEEVWKDITLSSLHDHSSSRELSGFAVNPNHPNSPHFILQDFLARPFTKDPPTNNRVVSTNGRDTAFYGSPAVPPPATVLCLNSVPGSDYLDTSDPASGCNQRDLQNSPISNLTPFSNCPFDTLASSSVLASFGKKRVQESDSSSGDRRHNRMIKNRESAARSRARKQAYTNELELEVAQLMEENARLKREQEELRVAAAAQISKKHTLHRSSTAPF